MNFKRVFLIVLDSLGIGGAKDAKLYDDEKTNTFGNIVKETGVDLPNLRKLGLYNLVDLDDVIPEGYYTSAHELSKGKDTLTGHLEIMGIKTDIPFKTFSEFPKDLIETLELKIGRKIIGNCDASGTDIIEKLGIEHIKTGALIVYTSADSVLQIAAHESVIPVKELYRICQIARELTLKEDWKVGRVIARPFIGKPGSFSRTPNRHDYALNPPRETILDYLKENRFDVISIGKISDIFNECGITKNVHTIDNMDGINKIIETMNEDFYGLCFANLNDFDSKYGHRRNVIGYANALKEFDHLLPTIMDKLNDDDLLLITADHGNDPTYKGTDHTRENVPLLIYSKIFKKNGKLKDLDTFADIGATIADNFDIPKGRIGNSFLGDLK